jgi:hypothetical protein
MSYISMTYFSSNRRLCRASADTLLGALKHDLPCILAVLSTTAKGRMRMRERAAPFHSDLPRRAWRLPSFYKPALPGKRPSSLPRLTAFSADVPRKVITFHHASRETDPV